MSIPENQTEKTMYLSQKDKVVEINEHYEGCRYENTSVPIDMCLCDCLERQIFMLGYRLHERLICRIGDLWNAND